MSDEAGPASAYTCPMHPEVRESATGKCPQCGMPLVARATGLAVLREIFRDPLNVALMLGFAVAALAAAMFMS